LDEVEEVYGRVKVRGRLVGEGRGGRRKLERLLLKK